MPDLDAITILTSLDGKPVNKIVRRAPDGSITKQMARHSGRFRARTLPAPDVHALAEVLREVGERADTCISLSVFRDAPESEFVVVSAAELAARLGVAEHDREALAGFHEIDGAQTAARIRESMTVGSWLLFDRDQVDDMPAALAELSFAEWREAVALLWPGFAGCGCIVIPSTSTRVEVDGAPLSSTSCHCFVRIDDPTELKDTWGRAASRSLYTEFRGELLSFKKPKHSRATDAIVAMDWGTIYDRSVAAVARLVFDGAPVARGDDLAVLPPAIEVYDGPLLERANVPDWAPRKEKALLEGALERIYGTRPIVNLTRNRTGRVTGIEVVVANLTMDLELETERGRTTVGTLHAEGVGHVRCQSPFRESTSWAAYYNVHRDGSPFVFDSGTGEKHIMRREGRATMSVLIREWLIEDYRLRFICHDGRIFSDRLGRRLQQREVTPTDEILDRLAMASDAPCDGKGAVKRLALPAQFNAWLKSAWGVLLRTLPAEDEVGAVSEPAAEGFCEQVTTLLTAMYRMSLHGGEARSFGSWACVYAMLQPGEWQRVGGLELWSRMLDDGLQIAFKPALATQTQRTFPEIGSLGLNQLTRRCRKYGIALTGDNRVFCEGHQIRAAILTAEFVATLNLSPGLNDPLAAALRARLNPETDETGLSRRGERQ